MKKSNALMLSYIIFLLITLIANLFFSWDEIEKISLSATFAGLFFAFADFANWRMICKHEQYTAAKKLLSEMIHSIDKRITFCERTIDSNNGLTSLIETKFKSDHPFNDVSNFVKATSSSYKVHAGDMAKMKDECSNMNNHLDKKILPQIGRWKNIEACFLIVGFVSFFVINSFANVYYALLSNASLLTVLSFGIIMLTYFLKDVYVNHDKLNFENLLQNIKQEEEKLEETMLNTDDLELYKEIIKYI